MFILKYNHRLLVEYEPSNESFKRTRQFVVVGGRKIVAITANC